MTSIWNLRGSVWHRWDPHIHAPGTALGDQFGGDWEAFLSKIENATPLICALGVTDYFCIQTYKEARVRQSQGCLPKVQFLFPNVEMRLDLKTDRNQGINIHLLFSPDDPNHEQQIERILGHLTFEYHGQQFRCIRPDLIDLGRAFDPQQTDDAGAFREGVNQFKTTLGDLRTLFRAEAWLRNNCLIAVAGSQSDGTSGLQNDGSFVATRQEVESFANIIFSGNPNDRDFWLGKKPNRDRAFVEGTYGSCKPCLHGSDAHKLERVGTPDLARNCWIKGDLAFESLRQAVIEPEERVWIGEAPPKQNTESVTISHLRPLGMPWLQNEVIELNPGLVAIIGARGSGKTALVDLIAAGAGAIGKNLGESSFLRRATSPVDLIGSAQVEETWADGTKKVSPFRPVDDYSDSGYGLPEVCYLSQQFVEQLCSSAGLAIELRQEIERVIFEQTEPTERYETDSFPALASTLLQPIVRRREQQMSSLVSHAEKIAAETQLMDHLPKLRVERTVLDEQLKKDRKNLGDLLPKGKEQRAQYLLELEDACTAAESKVENLRRRQKALDDLLSDAVFLRDRGEPQRLAEMKKRFSGAGLTDSQWQAFSLKFSGDVVEIITQTKSTIAIEIEAALKGNPASPIDAAKTPVNQWPLAALKVKRDAVKKEVGVDVAKGKRYDTLKQSITAKEKTLRNADSGIKAAEGAQERRRILIEARREDYRAIFETFAEEETVLVQLYQPLERQLKGAEGALAKLRLVVRRRVRFEDWVEAGEGLLDLRKDTRFRGHGALRNEASRTLLPAWRNGKPEDVAAAMQSFVAELSSDIAKAMPSSITHEERPEWFRKVGMWLFSTEHIQIEYGIEYDGVAVEQLSPGTRGIVLLLLYLVVDQTDRRPLLIDQPEENLDPKSVFEDLVPHFRDARKRRQVIIVTHNANLVVNTDADQVILATSSPAVAGQLPPINYSSGSLENPAIRRAVCDILEGGERAFLERERRYRLQWNRILEKKEESKEPAIDLSGQADGEENNASVSDDPVADGVGGNLES